MIIVNNGLVLSEFLPTTPPRKWTYLQRNRIVAWLSNQLILVEAPAKSGAVHIALQAISKGIQVWVVPWDPHWDSGKGCLQLIAAGAPIIQRKADLLHKIQS